MSEKCAHQIALRRQPDLLVQDRITRKNQSVVTDEREIASRRFADFRIKSLEILRQHRRLNDARETSIGAYPAAADAKERCSGVWRPRPQHRPQKRADVAIGVGLEVIAIGKINDGSRIADAVDQR